MNGNMVMPVAPMGGNNSGFGFGDGNGWWFLILFFLMCGNGWGNGFGGFGGNGLANDAAVMYPWMNQSNQIHDGFRDQMINGTINGIQQSITSGFGDTALGIAGINQNICQTGNGIVGAVTGAQNAITQQMYTNQIADMERSFAAQTAQTAGMTGLQAQLAQCCCDNRAATADLKYTVATENCADRTAAMQNTRDIIDAQTRGTQAILDKLCALELDGVKGQLAQAQRENVALQNAVNMATMQASQTAQTAQILAGQSAEIDGVYNRLKNCPVPSMPVYGNTPIFTCQNNGCGCNCGM
jgi:hypothetical protein